MLILYSEDSLPISRITWLSVLQQDLSRYPLLFKMELNFSPFIKTTSLELSQRVLIVVCLANMLSVDLIKLISKAC